MTTGHWSEDELIDQLYGVGPEDGHLERCPECLRRWQSLLQVRRQVLEAPSVSEQFLATERRAIRSRLGEDVPRAGWLRLASIAAATAVLLLAVALYRPDPVPKPQAGMSDAELYADVYSMVQSDEPAAVQPMHALFEAHE